MTSSDTQIPAAVRATAWQRLRRPMAKLPARLMRRVRRHLAPLLPVRGRLPAGWVTKIAPKTGTRTWRDHFTSDRGRGWYWSARECSEIIAWVRDNAPGVMREIARRADTISDGRISILGHGEVEWTPAMGWSRDPVAGVEFASGRAERVDLILPDNRSDMKHVWEPARFHYGPVLAVAHRLTGEDRYAITLRDYIADFIRENPCGYGIQWTNPMEVSIRAVNWLMSWQWCGLAAIFDESFVRTFIGSVTEHGRFIARHLERTRRGLNTNHYLGDLVGLYAIATFLPEWPESKRWRKLAWSELLAESEHQILPDGFCYESSFAYQRLTFEMWFFAWVLAQRHDEERSDVLASALSRMADFSRINADPTGHLPQFGDGDDGRFVYWEPRDPSDHTPIIHLAATLPGGDSRFGTTHVLSDASEDVLWLRGHHACSKSREQSARALDLRRPGMCESRVFPAAQIAVMRSDRWLVHAFANPVGTGGIGGHKHNDMLSLSASCDGIPIIIDPGTGAYTADPPARNRFRRTAAHATVVVDGAEQNRFVPGQLFCLWQDATPEILEFTQNDDLVRIVMRHDGYARLPEPVIHERTITLLKRDEQIRIKDCLEGRGRHGIAAVFPLGGLEVHVTGDHSARLIAADGPELHFSTQSEYPLSLGVELGWRSLSYGTKTGHRRLVLRGSVTVPAQWIISIQAIPRAVDDRLLTNPEAVSSLDVPVLGRRSEACIDADEAIHA